MEWLTYRTPFEMRKSCRGTSATRRQTVNLDLPDLRCDPANSLASQAFGPIGVWRRRGWLVCAEAIVADVCKYEILRCNGNTRQTPEQSQLARVRHCIGQRTLKQLFLRYPCQRRSVVEVSADILQQRVKPLDLVFHCFQWFGSIRAANEKGPCVP